MPSVSEYIALIRPGLRPSTEVSWGRYLTLMSERLAERDMNDISPTDIHDLAEHARLTAVTRRGGTGRSAAEHTIAAARLVWRRAVQDAVVQRNVALMVAKPRRVENVRTGLSERQVANMYEAGDERHRLVMGFFLETGARRAGLIALTPQRWLPSLQVVEVHEKGEKTRRLPVSERLATQLDHHDSELYSITRRKLESMWEHMHHWCPWAGELGVSSHWLRHTAAARYEKATGSYSLTAAWMGHTPQGATSTYLRHSPADIAHGWHMMTGERHPLCECPEPVRSSGVRPRL
jgi:integrase/recombinase XerC